MNLHDQTLWKALECKVDYEGEMNYTERDIKNRYLGAVEEICEYGIDRAITIRDMFPMYTLHDETHIFNVMRKMCDLLGEDGVANLTRDETATLILCACCHDIGMSYKSGDAAEVLEDTSRLNEYFDRHPEEEVKARGDGTGKLSMTEEMIRKYLRCIHHERAEEILNDLEWPTVLNTRVDRRTVVMVCKSHGEDITGLYNLRPTSRIDLRLCAILLRLADILDFDTSRAPQALYDYCGFDGRSDPESTISRDEWNKHKASPTGFNFSSITNRKYPYELPYAAICDSMKVQQAILIYLDWVDKELASCREMLHALEDRWRNLVLPLKVGREGIVPEGFVPGQYHLSLEQDNVLDLFVGENLYGDPAVFVRELLQNAIDAVRTRQQFDEGYDNPQINIRTWTEDDGYHWFRIEDNGIGMTKEVIENHLLKVGSSYYTSAAFEREKLRHGKDPGYKPISRFGIGILSCFMGDKRAARVEISTKHFVGNSHALRLSMVGLSGYYALSDKRAGHNPGPMMGVTDREKKKYRNEPGTVVAVRTDLNSSGRYASFKEIVDKYVMYPPVPIHYEESHDDKDYRCDYPTQEDLVSVMHEQNPSADDVSEGLIEIPVPENKLNEIRGIWPRFSWGEAPSIEIKPITLDRFSPTPYIAGAAVAARVRADMPPFDVVVGDKEVNVTPKLAVSLSAVQGERKLNVHFRLEPNSSSDGFDVGEIGEELRRIKELNKSRHHIMTYLESSLSFRDYYESAVRSMGLGHPGGRRTLDDAKVLLESQLNNTITWLDSVKLFLQRSDFILMSISLNDFEWYKRYVGPAFDRTGSALRICSHNGIKYDSDLLGNDGFDSSEHDALCVNTVVLLRDALRPNLEVHRDGVRSVTLETRTILEGMDATIRRSGFPSQLCSPSHSLQGRHANSAAYYDLYRQYEGYFANLPLIRTTSGEISLSQLEARLSDGDTIQMAVPRRDETANGEDAGNVQRTLMSYIQRHYEVKSNSFGEPDGLVSVSMNAHHSYAKGMDAYPPTFFVESMTGNYAVFAARKASNRPYLNASHPLARFMLDSARVMREFMPGIFSELIRCLTEEDGTELITSVNRLLSRVSRLKGMSIEVPSDAYLTESSLC